MALFTPSSIYDHLTMLNQSQKESYENTLFLTVHSTHQVLARNLEIYLNIFFKWNIYSGMIF